MRSILGVEVHFMSRKQMSIGALARQLGIQSSAIRYYERVGLLRGFSAGAPASARWRAVAERKIIELDASIAHARALKRLLTGARKAAALLTGASARESRHLPAVCASLPIISSAWTGPDLCSAERACALSRRPSCWL
jgi:hypothetical protein